MTESTAIREKLTTLQAELQSRLKSTQTDERSEVANRDDSTAQLWEASEIRDGLNDEATEELRLISRALARLDAGDYGVCSGCGQDIDAPRLEAVPYAELCLACAEKP